MLSTIRQARVRPGAGGRWGSCSLSPLLCLIALAIKLTSRGPVFYVQERIGRDGAPFPFIKFRTMVVGRRDAGRRHPVPQGRSASHASRARPSPLQPRRGAAAVQRPARRDEPDRAAPRSRLSGAGVHAVPAPPSDGAAGDHRLGAGERPERDRLGSSASSATWSTSSGCRSRWISGSCAARFAPCWRATR